MQRPLFGLALAFSLVAVGIYGQVSLQHRPRRPSPQPAIPSATLRVDTNLVLVPVTVEDELNRPITGLEKQNFHVYDDRVQQTITSLTTEEAPIALGLVFDTSGSMTGVLPEGRRAVDQFLKLANPDDEFFLVEFNTSAHLTVPLTSDVGSVHAEVLLSRAGGSTALFDALYMGIHEMHKSTRAKKAIVLISDGGENNSRYTPEEVKDLVRESDVLIYSVAEGGRFDPEAQYGLDLMNRIAEMTGAHMYDARRVDLADIAQKIAIELRNRYVLAYTPHDEPHDGKYHRIDVKLAPPRGLGKLQAHWRTGYYAPSE
jgi:Ca-activated chloride channel family protein